MALQTDTQAWRVEIGTRGLMFSNCVPLHLPEGQYHKLRLPVSAYEALAHRFPAIRRWAAIFTLRCHRASDETLFKRAQTLPYPPPLPNGAGSPCVSIKETKPLTWLTDFRWSCFPPSGTD